MTAAEPIRKCPECGGDSTRDDADPCDECDDYGETTGTWERISCEIREAVVSGYGIENLRVSSSLTNYFDDPSHINPMLPAVRATTWMDLADAEMVRDELDANGCRHWLAHWAAAAGDTP